MGRKFSKEENENEQVLNIFLRVASFSPIGDD
jgi:hypothetical protein